MNESEAAWVAAAKGGDREAFEHRIAADGFLEWVEFMPGQLSGTPNPMPPPVPPGYMWSLGLLYLVTAIVVTGLYFPCRWFARMKADARRPWMRFV